TERSKITRNRQQSNPANLVSEVRRTDPRYRSSQSRKDNIKPRPLLLLPSCIDTLLPPVV
ncbi:hypothetical protein M9458_051444, partial [Cirrhinus mrigala]